MTGNLTLRDLDEHFRCQEQRESAELLNAINAEWEKNGEIKDRDLLIRIGYSKPEVFEKLRSSHPAAPLAQAVENVRLAFQILEESRTALIDSAGQFHFRLVNGKGDSADRDELVNQATRQVYTYIHAALSLVQAYRHLCSAGANEIETKYDELKTQLLADAPILDFISGLRNTSSHVGILTASPHYKISFREERTVTSGIRFDREAILNGRFKHETKAWLSEKKDLQVLDLINEHFNLVSNFRRVVFVRTGVHDHQKLRDLGRIQLARETIGKKVWLGLVLQQAMGRRLNPYEYLYGWFTPDELQRIYSFRDHTKEQVDYMILLRDPLNLCDDHTRTELYKLFSVESLDSKGRRDSSSQ